MTLPPSAAEALLDQFLSSASPGPFAYGDCHHFPGRGTHRHHIVLGFAIHGNEHGSLPAALRLQAELSRHQPDGPVTLLLGNTDALRQDVRFLDEDFNRVFTFDRPAESRERKRAELVRPILDSANTFLDFHQTQTPTRTAFWTFPWDPTLASLARALGIADVGLTRQSGQAFSPGLCCLDEYVRGRGQIGLTVEVGFRGQDANQAERVYQGAKRLLEITTLIESGASDLQALADSAAAISWYQTAHVAKNLEPGLQLKDGLENWTPVAQGELLSSPDSPEIRSPVGGMCLFPKYAAPGHELPPELLRVATQVEDPASLS